MIHPEFSRASLVAFALATCLSAQGAFPGGPAVTPVLQGGGKVGTCVSRGIGCGGSKPFNGCKTVLPSYYRTHMGNGANKFPHAQDNMRYQQVFLDSEIGSNQVWQGVALRLDEQFGGLAQTVPKIEIFLGRTAKDCTNLTTNFASNYSSASTNVFSGSVNLPAWSGGGNITSFDICFKFSVPYVWTFNTGDNLLVEFKNHSTGLSSHYEDFCSGPNCKTARLWAFNANATVGTVAYKQGLVMCFKGPATPKGGIPVHGCVGVPSLSSNNPYVLNVTNAGPGPALFFLGTTPLNFSFGACTWLCSTDLLMSVRPVNPNTCSASISLAIPNSNSLLCFQFCSQVFVYDPCGDFFNVGAFTNALDHEIGN